MKVGSLFSGIGAPADKRCADCEQTKPLAAFHRQPSGQHGRHSYCADCFNRRYRGVKRKPVAPAVRRAQNFKSRYGLSEAKIEQIIASQGGACAICDTRPKRPVVDHDHATGVVRGILCHSCNIRLPAVEDRSFVERATAYLGRFTS